MHNSIKVKNKIIDRIYRTIRVIDKNEYKDLGLQIDLFFIRSKQVFYYKLKYIE